MTNSLPIRGKVMIGMAAVASLCALSVGAVRWQSQAWPQLVVVTRVAPMTVHSVVGEIGTFRHQLATGRLQDPLCGVDTSNPDRIYLQTYSADANSRHRLDERRGCPIAVGSVDGQ